MLWWWVDPKWWWLTAPDRYLAHYLFNCLHKDGLIFINDKLRLLLLFQCYKAHGVGRTPRVPQDRMHGIRTWHVLHGIIAMAAVAYRIHTGATTIKKTRACTLRATVPVMSHFTTGFWSFDLFFFPRSNTHLKNHSPWMKSLASLPLQSVQTFRAVSSVSPLLSKHK